MRLGLLARADNRGLGIQSWETYCHLNPAVTVVVDMSPIAGHVQKWPQYFNRYPDAIISPWGGYLTSLTPEAIQALMTVDVIVTFETWYDPSIPERAKQRGIATVIMVNPELWRYHETEHATAVWIPTRWRKDFIPRAEIVPMPVALDRLEGNPIGDSFLHLGGHKARADRNGMELAIRAARLAGVPMIVTSQDRIRVAGRGIMQGPTLDDYWQMYEGCGVLVMPRKYGGLCLGVQEAMAAGLAVIMTDTVPNMDWPVALVPCQRGQRIQMVGGEIELYEADRAQLADEMRRMINPDYRAEFQTKGKAWAQAHSWQVLKAEWLARLIELC